MSAEFFVNCESIKVIAEMRINELETDLKREPKTSQEKFEHELKKETLRLSYDLLKSGSIRAEHTDRSMRFMTAQEVGIQIGIKKARGVLDGI